MDVSVRRFLPSKQAVSMRHLPHELRSHAAFANYVQAHAWGSCQQLPFTYFA